MSKSDSYRMEKKWENCIIEVSGKKVCIDNGAYTLSKIIRKFTVLIIFVIKNKEKARFSEIVESVPYASNNIISKRLKFLQKENIVCKDPENLTYSLTEKGNEVYTKLRDILSILS